MLATGSVQEVMDLGGVAHLASIKSSIPFVHFFDGFRTSHEVQKIEQIDYSVFADLVDMDAIDAFRAKALNPEHPVTRGTAQNPDIFFQAKEASNPFYTTVPDTVADYMAKISEVTGRDYKPFNYYGAADAENVVIAMGSVTEALEELVDYLNAAGEKVGLLKVHLYRPFSSKYFFDAMPASVKKIAVLDRTKEPGSIGEPLYVDVRALYYDKEVKPLIVGGRYGLGSKDTTPTILKGVYDNLKADEPKNNFTIGIVDDVTNLSLPIGEDIVTENESAIRCKFWGGLGSDGTVGANKSAIKIIGDKTDMYAQGYFSYDSKKSGGITVSHLRFGKEMIRSTYLINEADYIACHNQSYVDKYDLLKGLKKGGTFVLNTQWSAEELETHLPGELKRAIAASECAFYTVNATDLAEEIGLGNRINMVMQAAFFKLADVMPIEDAVKYLKEAVVKSYGSKGEKIVNMNYAAIDKGIDALVKIDVPAAWATAADAEVEEVDAPDFIKNVAFVMNAQKGDALPVSSFKGREDGTFPMSISSYEKRGIAVTVPEWQIDNCIQCNQCAFVCPHSVIRPYLLDENEKANAPESFTTKPAIGKQFAGLEYKIQISPLDCTGCGNCADICPSKEKSLIMKPIESQMVEQDNFTYAHNEVSYKTDMMGLNTVKGSQFAQPLFEFSGACAGCGETPYLKVVTQLYGDQMVIANATGCSSIWGGGSAPASVFTQDADGNGPAWANSLFEDNAEYGYGMAMGMKQLRNSLEMNLNTLIGADVPAEAKAAFQDWIEKKEDSLGSKEAAKAVKAALANLSSEDAATAKIIADVKSKETFLAKKSQWIVGGDGWAYDIGYGGLDHVLASGENVNVLVFDTEVYSNTGGQASKATPTAAVAKFATAGMNVKKKDLGMICATYGYVYVAQVAMGANKNQFMKALVEAEAYDGPSIIIAYAPCIAHGIKNGMGKTQLREQEAVDAGYWHMWRYNPTLAAEGKNPFTLDSKEPSADFQEFLLGEVRYTSLQKTFPDEAEKLFAKAEQDAKERYASYVRMAKND